jgi:hypothetical protein
MFFGMTNSPATFQSMMNHIFKDLIDNGGVIIYMDNILIHATTQQQLDELTKKVLKILQDHELYLKTEKCEFETQKLEYLGVIITPDSIQMDSIKLKGIKEWPVPKTPRMFDNSSDFAISIRNLSSIMLPLPNCLIHSCKRPPNLNGIMKRN